MAAPFGRSYSFGKIPGLEQEIDRLYWMLGQMWGHNKSASEIGERRVSRNRSLDKAMSGELTAKSLRIGRTKDSIPIEKIETFVVDTDATTISANSKDSISLTDGDYTQLDELRRGTLFSVYLDPGHEDIIVGPRIVHASAADDNGILKVFLYNTTSGSITVPAGKAYFTLVTPRSF